MSFVSFFSGAHFFAVCTLFSFSLTVAKPVVRPSWIDSCWEAMRASTDSVELLRCALANVRARDGESVGGGEKGAMNPQKRSSLIGAGMGSLDPPAYRETPESLLRSHTLAPFTGLVVCVTGLEIEQRDYVEGVCVFSLSLVLPALSEYSKLAHTRAEAPALYLSWRKGEKKECGVM